jgi:hypothetical protein
VAVNIRLIILINPSPLGSSASLVALCILNTIALLPGPGPRASASDISNHTVDAERVGGGVFLELHGTIAILKQSISMLIAM